MKLTLLGMIAIVTVVILVILMARHYWDSALAGNDER
jgi:hypothetical protein